MVPHGRKAPDFRTVAGQAHPGLSSVWPHSDLSMPRAAEPPLRMLEVGGTERAPHGPGSCSMTIAHPGTWVGLTFKQGNEKGGQPSLLPPTGGKSRCFVLILRITYVACYSGWNGVQKIISGAFDLEIPNCQPFCSC